MALRKGQKLTINGEKLIVASINNDGTATLNYAAGSGKSGFRGKIVNPDAVKAATAPKAMFVDSIDTIDDFEESSVSLDSYNKVGDRPEVASNAEIADSLIKSGVDSKKVTEALTKKADYSVPSEEQINARLEFLESEKEFNDMIDRIANKKFGILSRFSSEPAYSYYGKAQDEVNNRFNKLKEKVNAKGKDSEYYKTSFEKVREDYKDMIEYVENKMRNAWDI